MNMRLVRKAAGLWGRLLPLAMVVFLCAAPAQANFDDTKYSESEKVGFAFYHLGKLKPQFDSWIKGSAVYQRAKPSEKSTILQKEQYRLLQGYYDYKLADDYIHVSLAVEFKLKEVDESPRIEEAVQGEEGKAIEITIHGVARDFFAFKVGGAWIAVAAENFENPVNLYLKPDEFGVLLQRLGDKAYRNRPISAVLDIYMRPISVDLKKPITSEGQKLWLMLTDIGSMIIWDERRTKILWQYAKPWYHGQIDKQLLDLYSD